MTRPRARSAAATAADQEAALAAVAMREHKRLCPKCSKAGHDATRYCGPGYRLAQALQRARRAASGADGKRTHQQDTLI